MREAVLIAVVFLIGVATMLAIGYVTSTIQRPPIIVRVIQS